MISDFVKGKKKFDFPPDIQQGIALHRAIDNFTDTHEATREAKEIFRPAYRLYSGAFVDVVYDHFLATDETEFTEHSLRLFSKKTYSILEDHFEHLPSGFAMMLPYMKTQDWLFNYRELWGIGKSLEGIVRRAAYLTESRTAFHLLEKHYELFQNCYRQFWGDIRTFALQQYESLRNDPKLQ